MSHCISPQQLGAALACAVLVAACGCGPSGPKTAAVSGVILDDGQPVPNVEVVFYPNTDGKPSYGSTDAEGRFDLKYSAEIQGAVIGFHRVSISPGAPGRPEPINYGAGETREPVKRTKTVRIAKPMTWPQPVEIVAGDNQLTFDLAKSGG